MGRVAVLGAGAWGTALAHLLAQKGVEIFLWGRSPEKLRFLTQNRRSPYLPGISLHPEIRCEPSLEAAVSQSSILLITVPSHAFRGLLKKLSPFISSQTVVAWGTKGFDPQSHRLLHEVVREVLPLPQKEVAVFSGPTFAFEVARGLPTAVTVASPDLSVADRVAELLYTPTFRPYTTSDVVGVEVGGAIKNVIAIAAGVSDGLGFGANARAALITRGLAEIQRFGMALGARRETFFGLAGVGDLTLTCNDDQSRNRRLGLLLAQGISLEGARHRIGQEIEGVLTCRLTYEKAEELGVEMPITEQVYELLYRGRAPREAVERLLLRERKREFE